MEGKRRGAGGDSCVERRTVNANINNGRGGLDRRNRSDDRRPRKLAQVDVGLWNLRAT